MANKRIIAIIFIIFFLITMSISIPIVILSTAFLPSVKIVETRRFKYRPKNSSVIEQLNLLLDIGNIEIQYTTNPVDYYAMIEVNFDMIGYGLFGKNSLYYFNFPENDSFTKLFNMERKSDTDWFDDSKWIKQNVSILVFINANIQFNINTTIREEGDVNINIPGGTSINNIDINIKTGDILYEFIYCIMRGNVTGRVDSGDITLKANNIKYTQNNIWNFTNTKGKITLDIIQSRAMGANLSGMGTTNIGNILLKYRDYSHDIGAIFKFHNSSTGIWNRTENYWMGFKGPIPIGYTSSMFTSYDYPSKYNYDLSFFVESPNTRTYMINLTSV